MKILIWSQHFWPENFCINDIAKELVKKQHTVTIFTGKPNYPRGDLYKRYRKWNIDKETFEGVEIIRIPIILRGKANSLNLVLNYLSFIILGYLLAPFILRKKNIDAIIVYGTSPLLQALPAIFLSWIKKSPLILWVQDLWPESVIATNHIKKPYLLAIIKKAVKFCYHHSDLILIGSESFKLSVKEHLTVPKKIEYLPNPSFDYRYKDNNNVSSLVEDISQYFSLVFAGNIGKAQSIKTILDAAEIIKEYSAVKIFLIGSGSLESEVYETIKEKRLSNVKLVPQLPQSCMPAIFNVASGLIVSLKKDACFQQTVPSKIQSYFSAGKPIIGSISGEGEKLILKTKTGLCASAEDALGLAKIIKKLYQLDPKEREYFGLNGRIYYEDNFTTEKTINKILNYIKTLI